MLRASKHLHNNVDRDIFDKVEIIDGSYSEITSHADSRRILFKCWKPTKTWKSRKLVDECGTFVDGFEQCLTRLYDTEEDAFLFSYQKTDKKLNVEEVLAGDSIWNKRDDLTIDEVYKICDDLIDKVKL